MQWDAHRGDDFIDVSYFDRMLPQTHVYCFRTQQLAVAPHAAPFSLKVVLSGTESYTFGRRAVVLPAAHWMLVEAGRTYSSSICRSTQALTLFFPRALRCEALLPLSPRGGEQTVDSIPWRADAAFRSTLDELKLAMQAGNESHARALAELLLAQAVASQCARIPPHALATLKRRSTREELLPRLVRAYERLWDEYGRCDLDSLAATACLSRFHFIRLFSKVFGCTPMRLAGQVRLARAAPLVAAGRDVHASRIAGFSSLQSFRRALRRAQRSRR